MVHTPASDRDVPRPRAMPPAGQINPQTGECHYLSLIVYWEILLPMPNNVGQYISYKYSAIMTISTHKLGLYVKRTLKK